MKANHFIKNFFIALMVGLFLTTWNILIPRAADPSTAYLYAPNEPDTTVTNVSPSPNSHTASLNTTLAITLSEAINEATVTNQSLIVHGGGHGHMDGTITFGSIYYDPSQDFFPGELVQTSVTAGVLDGNNVPITPYVWQFRAAAGTGPGIYLDTGQSLGPVNGYNYGVALGDLDGDGDLDAFVGSLLTNQPNKVWLNNGQGIFTATAQNLASNNTVDVALGDLDGDGDLDAYVVNSNQASQLWFNNGAGTFTNSGQVLGSITPTTVALGDVDGDGDLDIYEANFNGIPNKLWLNNGTGIFADSGQSLGISECTTVDLGDLDGDGDLDAFIGNYYNQPEQVWLNDGEGIFTDSGQSLGNADTYSVDLGDVDGDGDLDAFVTNWNSQPDKVWLNNGTGTFMDSGQNLGFLYSHTGVLGDVDGDGDLDAFVGNDLQTTKLWLNDGAGVFINSGQSLGTTRTAAIGLGDLDGDGDLDAFFGTLNNTDKVWLNEEPPVTVTSSSPPANSHVAPVNTPLTINFSEAISTSTVTTQTVFVHGGGHGQMDGTISFGSIIYNPTMDFFPGELVQTSISTGVLDSLGRPVIPYNLQFRAAAGPGPGGFSDSGQRLGFYEAREVALGDLDGDGDLDAFTANYISQPDEVWLNDGLGNFSNSGQNLGNGWGEAVALGDVDGDGDLDAFVGNYDGPNKLWLNDGTGSFTDSGQSMGDQDTFAVALGDVDGDGDLDAYVGNWNQPNQVWLNNGTGTFTNSGQSLGTSLTVAVVLGDVDGDGDLDAFVGNRNLADKVWLNNGTGTFIDSGQNLGTASCAGVALGDVDSDGDLDAYVVNDNQISRLWLNNGTGTFSNSGQNLGTMNATAVTFGDVDGDGDLDAFVANSANPNEIWWNNGTGTFTPNGQSLGGNGSRTVALGDLDGDDDLDAFVGYRTLEPDKVWLNEVPEIEVTGNGQAITDGDITPSTTDGTDFGGTLSTGGMVTHTFTINNSGEGNLSLGSAPAIMLTTGTHFTVTGQPDIDLIAPGNVITFELTFDPLSAGTFTDTVTIANNDLNENSFTFVISGTGLNLPPLANSDAYTTTEDLSLMIAAPGVLGNDTDGDSDPLIAVLDNDVSHGTITLNSNGSFIYTPEANFCGEDSFTYHAEDGIDPSGFATVSLSVTCVADAPLANNDSYETNEDTSLTSSVPGVLGNDTDGDNDPLTALLDADVSHGTLTLNSNGSFSYAPDPDYCGLDTFTYFAHDGQTVSNLATVSLTVTCVNDAPFSLPETYTATEDTPFVITAPGVLSNDTDVENDPLSAVLDSSPTNGTLNLNSNGGFTYTPEANYCGADSFTYHAYDGQAVSPFATVSLTVTCVNDAPLSVGEVYTTSIDVPLTISAPGVLANDIDWDGDPLTVTLDTNVSNGNLLLNSNGSFDYTSNAGYCGLDSFTYLAFDGEVASSVTPVTLNVLCPNEAPVAVEDVYTTTADVPLVVLAPGVLANDTDENGDFLTAVLVTAPDVGTLALNADGSFVYTPMPGYTGVVTFTYIANDGVDVSEPVTVTIVIQPAPVTEFWLYLPIAIR